ncbi:hypothetical protein M513_03641 [Trichuris suis]|uniref:Uncharacterized protein n=1 Tax=Trichuris suis TaxID=68888 RepID=A0A085MEE3_9BILA|nr:hypothetical protein M513_03641 [Trichuris suis]
MLPRWLQGSKTGKTEHKGLAVFSTEDNKGRQSKLRSQNNREAALGGEEDGGKARLTMDRSRPVGTKGTAEAEF